MKGMLIPAPCLVFFFLVFLNPATTNAGLVNLALSGGATARGYFAPTEGYSETFEPGLAIDGDPYTRWADVTHGTASNPSWLIVDLKNLYSVNQITLDSRDTDGLYSDGNYYNVYNLLASQNGANWTSIGSGTIYDSEIPGQYYNTFSISATNSTLRYVKYEVVGGTHWANINEIGVYGNSSPVPIPSSMLLLFSGLGGLIGFRSMRNK